MALLLLILLSFLNMYSVQTSNAWLVCGKDQYRQSYFRCGSCDKCDDVHQVVKVNCTSSHNTICKCESGYYHNPSTMKCTEQCCYCSRLEEDYKENMCSSVPRKHCITAQTDGGCDEILPSTSILSQFTSVPLLKPSLPNNMVLNSKNYTSIRMTSSLQEYQAKRSVVTSEILITTRTSSIIKHSNISSLYTKGSLYVNHSYSHTLLFTLVRVLPSTSKGGIRITSTLSQTLPPSTYKTTSTTEQEDETNYHPRRIHYNDIITPLLLVIMICVVLAGSIHYACRSSRRRRRRRVEDEQHSLMNNEDNNIIAQDLVLSPEKDLPLKDFNHSILENWFTINDVKKMVDKIFTRNVMDNLLQETSRNFKEMSFLQKQATLGLFKVEIFEHLWVHITSKLPYYKISELLKILRDNNDELSRNAANMVVQYCNEH